VVGNGEYFNHIFEPVESNQFRRSDWKCVDISFSRCDWRGKVLVIFRAAVVIGDAWDNGIGNVISIIF
jgi:hypothetical protein